MPLVQPRECLREAEDGEQGARGGEAEAGGGVGAVTHGHVLVDHVGRDVLGHGGLVLAHVGDVGAHEVGLERLELELGVRAEAVHVRHVLGQPAVVLVCGLR